MAVVFWCLLGVGLFYLALYGMLALSYRQNFSA